jgi:molecular chaperone DnaK
VIPEPIGIDLGTTYSVIATIDGTGRAVVLRNADGQTTTPSVVLFDGADVLVGLQAKAQRAAYPDDVVEFVKRQMGSPSWRYYAPAGGAYTPEGISALILKRLVADAAIVLGHDITQVVVTVPAYFDDAQRTATKHAGEIAGLDVLAVVNEPTAAALSYGIEADFDGTVLVYDLGGGTFDVSLLRSAGGKFDIIRTDGERNLGGFDFDNEIIAWIQAELEARTGQALEGGAALAQLRDVAEQAKHRLSSSEQTSLFISAAGRSEKLALTRKVFENLTASLLARTEMLVEDLVEGAGLAMSEVDKVLLIGGSTRMPMVVEMMARVTRQDPDRSAHPDESVARGAAIVADLRQSERSGNRRRTASSHELSISDVVTHGLGVVSLDEQQIERNSIIIAANSKIPGQRQRKYFTVVDDQTQIHVRVTEGDEEDLRYVRTLGESMLTIPAHPAGSPIGVTFSCDVDGILHIQVVDLLTSANLGEFEIDRSANLARAEVDRQRVVLTNVSLR